MATTEEPTLDLDATLPRIFAVWWRNLPVFAGIAAICLFPSLVLGPLVQPGYPPGDDIEGIVGLLGLGFLASMIELICTAFAVGAIVHAVLADLRGESITFATAASSGLRSTLPAAGVLIVHSLGVSLGCFLCCVPGLLLLTFWFTTVPVAVVERPGLIESFARSQRLVLGSLVQVFIVIAIVWLGIRLVGIGVVSGVVVFFGGQLAGMFVGWALGVFGTALIAVAQAVVYHDLRGLEQPAAGAQEPA